MNVFVLGSYVNANSLYIGGQLPRAGESVQAARLLAEHGGKGLNLAIGMQRLGLQVNTLLAVGMDAPGQSVLELLQREGMDTQLVLRLPDASGFGVGLVAENGDNIIVVYPGANAQLSAMHVEAANATLAGCQLVCAQFEIPDAPIQQAFQLARMAGIKTLLTPSPWRSPDPAILMLTDILVLNETEAMALFGITSATRFTTGQWLGQLPSLAWSGELLVITLAERGCVALQKGERPVHEPAMVISLQDPTGAGDAFTAGLACALLQGLPLNAVLRFANACGALVAARRGVISALPSQDQANTFMLTGLDKACVDSSVR